MKYLFFDPEKIIDTPSFDFITAFLRATDRTQIGWHYFLDLTWIYSQAKNWPTGYRILDAGGGNGPTQFLLTELGFNVTNMDLVLVEPEPCIQSRYRMEFESSDSYQDTIYVGHLSNNSNKRHILRKVRNVISGSQIYQHASTQRYRQTHDKWRADNGITNKIGQLKWIRANLCNIPEIASNSFDAVVSLSALEHIPIKLLPQAWVEIARICKPDAKVAITTSATEQETTWFHRPSKGYCFSEKDLKLVFGATPDKSNLSANEIIEKYSVCTYLKNNLACFYNKSGDNGMPWGKWDPKYFPIGLFR